MQIADDAKKTLPIFFRHLAMADTLKKTNEYDFCIKIALSKDTADYDNANDDGNFSTEQVWLTDIHSKNGQYFGCLANNPTRHNELKKGSKITFSTDCVTDWMYVQNGKISGGYSIKYLLEKIPEAARSEEQQKILEMFD